jgi:hypothetical protein
MTSRKLVAVEVPEGHKLTIDLLLSRSSRGLLTPEDFNDMPLVVGATYEFREHRLRSGRRLVIAHRVCKIGAEDEPALKLLEQEVQAIQRQGVLTPRTGYLEEIFWRGAGNQYGNHVSVITVPRALGHARAEPMDLPMQIWSRRVP